MRLVEFSVSNYRSITTAQKIPIHSLTVLVGKNNEGKSNLLNALNVAMNAVIMHSRQRVRYNEYSDRYNLNFNWYKDFPIQFRNRRIGLESIFKLNFRLEGDEITEFQNETGIRSNEDIPISIKIGEDNKPKITVPKRGSSSYNKKSRLVTEFISKRISFNYIQAIRTEKMAISALEDAIYSELLSLETNEEYIEAMQKVDFLHQEILDRITEKIKNPLMTFLPNLKDVSIQKNKNDRIPRLIRNEIDIILDDGVATSIKYKGDGIKSLVTLALLKDKVYFNGSSVIAIEEPESHLHSGAIHGLVNVINKMSENNQVIITTHNPLFVQQNKLNSNIIVNQGTAHKAKTISEIREILGVWPSDNLRDARFAVVVEGESDKTYLLKLLPFYSTKIKQVLQNNQLVIQCLGGAGNICHVLNNLKNNMCNYVVLLDHDVAGIEASEKAKSNNLLKDSEFKYTICNGMKESEFEDCFKFDFYKDIIKKNYNVNLDVSTFRGNKKWSVRMKETFLNQGSTWDSEVEKSVKNLLANNLPTNISQNNIFDIIIQQKSGFIYGLVTAIELMILE